MNPVTLMLVMMVIGIIVHMIEKTESRWSIIYCDDFESYLDAKSEFALLGYEYQDHPLPYTLEVKNFKFDECKYFIEIRKDSFFTKRG